MPLTGALARLALATMLLATASVAVAATNQSVDPAASKENAHAPARGSPSFDADEPFRNSVDNLRSGSHSFRLSELQSVSIEGIDYYAFSLDARETAPGRLGDRSLDVLRLYFAGRGDIESLDEVAIEGSLGWEKPAGSYWERHRDGGIEGRGNNADRREVLIPRSAFEGIDPDRYLYLYSRFAATSGGARGRIDPVEDSDELDDWYALRRRHAVAEPGTMLLIATGLLAASLGRRRRER